MRVRFDVPEGREAERDDGMRVHYAPARRPRLRYGGWYLLLACLALVLVTLAVTATGVSLCR